jgi:hypothetical protein
MPKIPLCFINYATYNKDVGAEVILPTFLTSALDGGISFTPRLLYPLGKSSQEPLNKSLGGGPELVRTLRRRQNSLARTKNQTPSVLLIAYYYTI